MQPWKHILATLATAIALPAAAANLSDLWWNPQESGWGANIVQQGDKAFVTLFVHGPDGEPTWLVSPDASVRAYGPQGLPYFEGTVYRVRGSWFGGAFDAARTQATPVGTISISPLSAASLSIEYTAGGVPVRKVVTRQSWSLPQPAYWYGGALNLRQQLSGGQTIGMLEYEANLQFELGEGEVVMKVDRPAATCIYRGAPRQSGHLIDFSGTFTCEDGPGGTFEVTGLEFTEHGVAGYLRTTRPDRHEYGRFGAARY